MYITQKKSYKRSSVRRKKNLFLWELKAAEFYIYVKGVMILIFIVGIPSQEAIMSLLS